MPPSLHSESNFQCLPHPQAHLTLVLDGYSAPLTAGNFVRNVLEGIYSNAALKVDQGAILAGGGSLGEASLPKRFVGKSRMHQC